MNRSVGFRLAPLAAWLLACGCTALREIPREQYALSSERKHVRVETAEGLRYDFDYVSFAADSLTGYRRRDVEGMFDQFDALESPLDRVGRVSVRRLDWYRTGLLGGSALAVVLTTAFSGSSTSSPGGGVPKPGP